ncbi:major facilitator superfamily domain-containing protein [Aspergillus ambiguus]|uniref:major facilitator superfamily domain-containing protein n=1 Tax=Aspergillus ambiguus TaxID=176160 RepID=UPI003CCCAD6D
MSETKDDSRQFPKDDRNAWIVALGSFLAMFSVGLLNATGTFQAYLEKHQLHSYSPGIISWIFGVYVFLAYFCAIQAGPVFDARGPRPLMVTGIVLTTIMLATMGNCSHYAHFLAVIGIVGGTGASMVQTSAISVISHFFQRHRGVAMGAASSGASIGGICIPLLMDKLTPRIGWSWATRVVALVCFILAVIGCLLMRSTQPKKSGWSAVMPTLSILADPVVGLTAASIFFQEWGLFVPLNYLPSYGIDYGISTSLAHQTLSILNASSFFGRFISGLVSDRVGHFNTLFLTVTLCLVTTVGLWFSSAGSLPLLIVYCIGFGFANGSNISLAAVCVGQLCDTADYGHYYSTVYTVASFAPLTSMPIAGEILTRCSGKYWGLITFSACCYAMAAICIFAAKLWHTGFQRLWVRW